MQFRMIGTTFELPKGQTKTLCESAQSPNMFEISRC